VWDGFDETTFCNLWKQYKIQVYIYIYLQEAAKRPGVGRIRWNDIL
jgi:hypothetical protein